MTVVAVGDDGVVGVDECGGDVGYVVPVGRERGGLGCDVSVRCAALSRWRGGGGRVCRRCGARLGDDFAVGAGYGFEGAGFEGDLEGDGAGVGVEFLRAEGFVVEEELDLFGVGVDFDVFGVGGLVFWASSRGGAAGRSGWWGRVGRWARGGGLIVGGG